MADAPKTEGGGSPYTTALLIFGGIALLVFIAIPHVTAKALTYINLEYWFYQFYELILWIWHVIQNGNIYSFFIILLGLITVCVAFVSAYAYIRTKEIEDAQKVELKKTIVVEPKEQKNDRWANIQKLMKSESESDWRQAIIEADIILDEMVSRMNVVGDNLADRLKNVQPSKFKSLQDAWEAHKIRNRIAHDGSAFVLSKHEAKRVIVLYENVFKEFGFI